MFSRNNKKNKKDKKVKHTKNHNFFKISLLKHDRQTDGQSNVSTRCAYVIGIFILNFNGQSSIAAEKINQRNGLTD